MKGLERGRIVFKTGGDYTFVGRIVATFNKWNSPEAVRVVVEDDRGLLLIMNPKQIQLMSENDRTDGA